ncbi:hypothetical protein KIN20_029613 [Parelaphostrongylus tenuis]|uniref:Uncharacterized protein n=1 Tax=Parelaphostrongylus tenuis TaxID=148309 RepID=A0AAD5R313_PARTN|nr:hypothetical protein KIN20_029613 [Parelaphostrongylus tenuis]
MASSERPSISAVPEENGEKSQALKKIESRRRSSRGRRSSIKVVVEGSSPATIVAPLSDSILNNKAVDQETQLIQRRDNVLSYRAHLQFEKEEWNERYERQKLLLQLTSRDSERPLECRNSRRLSIVDSTPVRSTVNRVLRTFHNLTRSLSDEENTVDKLQREVEAMEKSIESLKSKEEKLVALLTAEPRSELLAQKNWWEELKNKLPRRRELVEKRLAQLKSLDPFLEENLTIDMA